MKRSGPTRVNVDPVRQVRRSEMAQFLRESALPQAVEDYVAADLSLLMEDLAEAFELIEVLSGDLRAATPEAARTIREKLYVAYDRSHDITKLVGWLSKHGPGK